MAFCIFHNYCGAPVKGDNGNCAKYVGTARVNHGVVRCSDIASLPEDKWAPKKEVKAINPLKASKKAAGK